jgi:CheY-like chemotaxis protein
MRDTGGGNSIMGKGKILIMDDNAIVNLANVRGLRNLQYEAEATRDGFAAIRIYKKEAESGKPFDVVVLDLIAPPYSMGGEEAIKKLLEIDPDVKAIVASTSIKGPVMTDFRKYGFNGVLVKPYGIHELDETIQKVIGM